VTIFTQLTGGASWGGASPSRGGRAGKDQAWGPSTGQGGGMGGEGPGRGKFDGCIMHQVHTSLI